MTKITLEPKKTTLGMDSTKITLGFDLTRTTIWLGSKKVFLSFLLSVSAIFCLSLAAHAGVTPLGVGIVPPVQFPPDDFSVTGARLSLLWGRHRDVYGLDVGGVGNITKQSFVGVGVSGIFNATHGSTTILGLQLAGVANVNTNKTTVVGLQAALLNKNDAESSLSGLQVGAVNLSDHMTVYGVQAGLYNTALKVYGLQVGVVNMTESLHGLQIGLVNFHRKGTFVVSPILNFGF